MLLLTSKWSVCRLWWRASSPLLVVECAVLWRIDWRAGTLESDAADNKVLRTLELQKVD